MAASWWYEKSKEGNPEGDLIIGWMVKYNLFYDPSHIDYKDRFKKVLDKGWYIPNWLYEDNCSNINQLNDKIGANKNIIELNVRCSNVIQNNDAG